MKEAVETNVSAVEILAYLNRLQVERFEAKLVGLGNCASYMSELDEEITHCRSAFVATAVTEIAVLRGQLSGQQCG
jgi:hypothetical protein